MQHAVLLFQLFNHLQTCCFPAGLLVYWITKSRVWGLSVLVAQWIQSITDIADSVGPMLFWPFTTESEPPSGVLKPAWASGWPLFHFVLIQVSPFIPTSPADGVACLQDRDGLGRTLRAQVAGGADAGDPGADDEDIDVVR